MRKSIILAALIAAFGFVAAAQASDDRYVSNDRNVTRSDRDSRYERHEERTEHGKLSRKETDDSYRKHHDDGDDDRDDSHHSRGRDRR